MSKPQPSNKILIVLSFWEQDKQQAHKLARLLADLEPHHSEYADFLLVARFDCDHDAATVRHMSRKFNTFTHTSKRREIGWPNGCNGTFFGSMEWIYHRMASGKIPHYKSIFNIGADCGPLKQDWLPLLSSTWDVTNQRAKTYVAGAFIKNPARDHINGDAMMLSTDLKFLKWLAVDVGGIKAVCGWDWALAGDFHNWGWVDFPWIKSLWRCPTFTQTDWDMWRNAGMWWLHGIKDDSLLDLARKNLL